MSASELRVTIDVIVTGTIRIPAGYVYRPTGQGVTKAKRLVQALVVPGDTVVRSQCLAYVLRHPSAGPISVDTGFHPDAIHDRRKDFGAAMSFVFRGLRVSEPGYEEQLRRLAVEPASVQRTIMTHLHVDHSSGMRLLPNSRFLISRAEWHAAQKRGMAAKGFIAQHYPRESRVDLVDFARDGEPYPPFRKTFDLLGDGSIRLISTPGHTLGHMSVLVRAAGDRQVLIVGDAAYTLRNIDEQLLPLLTADDRLSKESLRELKAFKTQIPSALIVPTHDPTAWRLLRGAGQPNTDTKETKTATSSPQVRNQDRTGGSWQSVRES